MSRAKQWDICAGRANAANDGQAIGRKPSGRLTETGGEMGETRWEKPVLRRGNVDCELPRSRALETKASSQRWEHGIQSGGLVSLLSRVQLKRSDGGGIEAEFGCGGFTHDNGVKRIQSSNARAGSSSAELAMPRLLPLPSNVHFVLDWLIDYLLETLYLRCLLPAGLRSNVISSASLCYSIETRPQLKALLHTVCC